MMSFAALALQATLLAGTSDELAVGFALANAGTVVRVPVHVRDRGNTLLDEGDGPDREIQSFAFQVVFSAAFVDAIGFEQAGVTAGRTAFFSQVAPAADNVYVLEAFDETTDPLVFTLDAAAPGDVIGELVVTIDGAVPNGTFIALTPQTANAALIDDSATESETVGNGMLAIFAGGITVGTDAVFSDGFE